jgi:hypothetical protein
MVIDVPLEFGHQFWAPLVASVDHHLLNEHRNCTALWVSRNGLAVPGQESLSPYWVMAGLIFPLPVCPKKVQELLEKYQPAPSTKENGHKKVFLKSHSPTLKAEFRSNRFSK